MTVSQFIEAGIILLFVKALAEPTAVHIGEAIWRYLDRKLNGIIPDYLHKDDHD